MRLIVALLLGLGPWSAQVLHADNSASASTPRFPAPYSNYQIVNGSSSHDERFAAILRDFSQGYIPDAELNLLIQLSPFRVLAKLPTDACYVDGSRERGLCLNWNKDDSAAVLIQNGKLGLDKMYILDLASGKIVKTTDLLAILIQFVSPDFKKSGADSFNGNFDFFLDSDSLWVLNEQNQIPIDCEFTNDPRLSAQVSWTGTLTGTWDEKSGKLIGPHFVRTSHSK